MPTSAAGSRRGAPARRAPAAGFTLIELLVTLVVMAMLSALAALALPGGNDENARVEAQRLAALLDTAREQAAALAMPVAWAPGPDGYDFLRPSQRGWVPVDKAPLIARPWAWLGGRVPRDYQPRLNTANWYSGSVRVRVVGGGGALGAAPGWLVFGGEPVSHPMLLQLDTGSLLLTVSSNGAQPFRVQEQR
jgi:general secretion pathway protein H